MHPPSSLPHFRGLSLSSSQTWVLSIPWIFFFFFGQLFLKKPRTILFFLFLPTGWSCNLFLAFYQKLKMVSKIMHNMWRHILQRGEEDGIKWTGRPGPEKICALPCFTLSASRGCGLCAVAVPSWLFPSVQQEHCSGCTMGGPRLPLVFSNPCTLLWGNKTHSWL